MASMRRHQALAGIDIGTSGAKSVLINQDGNLLAWAGQEYPLDAPYPDWAEQIPRRGWMPRRIPCADACKPAAWPLIKSPRSA